MLAFEIVAQLNSKVEAEEAEEEFEKVFQKRGAPDSIATITIKEPSVKLADFLVENSLAASKSEAKRLIMQGAVKVGSQAVKNIKDKIELVRVNVNTGEKSGLDLLLERASSFTSAETGKNLGIETVKSLAAVILNQV